MSRRPLPTARCLELTLHREDLLDFNVFRNRSEEGINLMPSNQSRNEEGMNLMPSNRA